MKKKRLLLALAAVLFVLSLGISKKTFADETDPVDIGIYGNVAFVDPQDANLKFTGNPLTPGITVTYNNMTLTQTVDYDLTYINNIYPGTATIQISGKGNYGGVKKFNFNILKADQDFTVSLNPKKLRLKGNSTVKLAGTVIGARTYKSSKPAVASITKNGVITGKTIGTTKITVTAAGNANYNQRTVNLKVKVIGQELTKARTKITLSKATYTYDGRKKTPVVTVKYRGKKLKKNRDYKVYYQDNKNAGKATVTVKGIKQYDGSLKKQFTINKAKNNLNASISNSFVDLYKTIYIKIKKANGDVTFQSSNKSVATVNSAGYITGRKIGNCTIIVTAAGDINHLKATKKFKIRVGVRNVNDKLCKVSMAKKKIYYDGSVKLPYVNASYNGETMKLNRDYTLEYSNNKNAGLATIRLKGKGRYKGTRKITFRIYKAYQTDFKAYIPGKRIPLNGTAKVNVSGGRGDITYGCKSPSYVEYQGNGVFKGLKKTVDGVTITVTAEGDENYRTKTINLWTSIN